MKHAVTTVLLLLCVNTFAQTPQPKDGYIPDSTTAVRVGEAVLTPIYGKQDVTAEEPFKADLRDGVWIVMGSTCNPTCGSRVEIHIDKRTGAILSFRRLHM
jgi:NTF2 fold immunity protein